MNVVFTIHQILGERVLPLLIVLAVLSGISPLVYLVLWIVMPEQKNAATKVALPDHPRAVEEWKFDPYTGERIER